MFISENFIFDGTSNVDKNVALITFDNDVLNNVGVAFNRNISTNDGYSHLNPSYKVEDTEVDEAVLNLVYVDENFIPQEWNDSKIINIKEWLVTDYFAPFISEDNPDYIYYFMCTKAEKKMSKYMEGYLEVTFKVLSHFVYKKFNKTIITTNNSSININNPSAYVYKPIFKLKNNGDINTINKIGDFEIKGLSNNEVVTIDNLQLTIENQDGVNKYANCNRAWVNLNPGVNTLNISGNCEVEILCEFPILM